MKIIDVLNKIANGEEVPKKIKYDTLWYQFRNYDYKEIHKGIVDEQTSFIEKIDFYKLNDEVEIIEDKKIEKIDQNDRRWHYGYSKKTDENVTDNLELLREKVNKIIDYINKEKE
jgi:hypothetical protein